MKDLCILAKGACLCLCIGLTTVRSIGQESQQSQELQESPPSLESSPPPLFSERTEEQVTQFLANAPPGANEQGKPGLKVFTSDQFPTGHQLAYLIASCACLCLLVPGACIIFTSVQGRELTPERTSHLVFTLGWLSLTWMLFVYSIAFSRNAHSYDVLQKEIAVLERESAPGNIFIGDLGNSLFRGVLSNWGGGIVRHPMRRVGDSIPHSLFMVFQMMLFLQAVVPLLAISHSKLSNWTTFPLWLLWSIFVYAPLSYWTRGGGWLADCVDAGGTVPVHLGVGFTALGLWASSRSWETFPSPAHRPWFVSGAILFLSGSLLLAACRSVAHASWPTFDFLNVFLGGVTGVLSWQILAQRSQAFAAADWPLGMISGIVSVTAACASIPPGSSIIVAAVGVFACCMALNFRSSDRSLPWILFAIYGVSGYVGLVLVGVFSSPEIAGSDVTGKPMVGILGGSLEMVRVQLLTATVTAIVALLGGCFLPSIARAIGSVIERLFARKRLAPEDLIVSETAPHA